MCVLFLALVCRILMQSFFAQATTTGSLPDEWTSHVSYVYDHFSTQLVIHLAHTNQCHPNTSKLQATRVVIKTSHA